MVQNVNIQNRKSSHDYSFIRTLVAGIQLIGSEVKQLRESKVSLVDSFCFFDKNELFVKGMNITKNDEAFSHDPERIKKLLLTKHELKKLKSDLDPGVTIIVKRIFTNERGIFKAEIALAKGKKNYDKRESLRERDIEREIRREYSK